MEMARAGDAICTSWEEVGESSGSGSPEDGIECGCCFADYPFQQMVQCADGHLFCLGCLQKHVEQVTFGGGQSFSLPCMETAGCADFFPRSEVERAIPPEMLVKLEARIAEESVARAKLNGLVYCPFCNYPCDVDQGLLVLECQSCYKASCIRCREPEHRNLRCDEVEKKSVTNMRCRIEELMTKAVVRECTSCKAELVKHDGCNKITCRCGSILCYLCRKQIEANYDHFCQHPRQPGKPCSTCNKCGLWTKEEPETVVRAAKKAAMVEAALREPRIANRKIGPKLDEARKKVSTCDSRPPWR